MPPPILSRTITGVVVSAGKMMRAVKVRVPRQVWNSRIRKHYPVPYNVLVSDPTSTAREGDVVAIASGWRTSKSIRHVVSQIISPFGPPLSERPPLLTMEERAAARAEKRLAKDRRQAERGRKVSAMRVRAAEEGKMRETGSRTREVGKSAEGGRG